MWSNLQTPSTTWYNKGEILNLQAEDFSSIFSNLKVFSVQSSVTPIYLGIFPVRESRTSRLILRIKKSNAWAQVEENATMQNRFRKLDIFSISVLLDCLFATDISRTDRFW